MILMGIEVEDTAIIEFKNLAFFKKICYCGVLAFRWSFGLTYRAGNARCIWK